MPRYDAPLICFLPEVREFWGDSADRKTVAGRATAITLLQEAAVNGHLAMVRELLKRGASVDLQTSLGGTASTALIEAAYHGNPSIVLVLLQHSAKIDMKDIVGFTALMSAAYQGHDVREGPATSQGQPRSARQQRQHRPAVGRD